MDALPQSHPSEVDVYLPDELHSRWKLESNWLKQRGEPMSLKPVDETFGCLSQGTFSLQATFAEDMIPFSSVQSNGSSTSAEEELSGAELMQWMTQMNLMAGQSYSDSDRRWWRKLPHPLSCPLTQLPISLLPYPPFKR